MEEGPELEVKTTTESKSSLVSYRMSRRNINFIRIAYKIGNFICITPWYDFEKKSFVNPVINLVYSALLGAILILIFITTVKEREFMDEKMVQKFLVTFSDVMSITLTEYSVVAATVLHKEKWKVLLGKFEFIDNKLENDYRHQFKFLNNFYLQLILGHMYFIGCYTYKAYIWSNILGFRYFSNFGTMVIPMYYCFFSVMLLSNIVLAFRRRYEDLNCLLDRKVTLHQSDEGKLLKDIEQIRQYYRHLGDTVVVFNDIFGWVIILLLLHSIIEILNCVNLLLRSFVDPAFSWGLFSSCIWVCSLSMGGAIYIVLCCDYATSEGSKIVRLCSKLTEKFERCSECRLELSKLADFAQIYRPRFLAANFFIVERSTILGITSIATTYLIVVIQFNSTFFNAKNK